MRLMSEFKRYAYKSLNKTVLTAAVLAAGVTSVLSTPAVLAAPAETAMVYDNTMPSLAPMLEDVTPAVVNISVTRVQQMPDVFGFRGNGQQPPVRRSRGAGSGVVIDSEEGYIVTNHHVVTGADTINVALLDGRVLEAELIGSDEQTDIALLRVEAERLTAIELADAGRMRIGDYVVAIGNPFGIGQTVTSGIISALGRAGINNDNYEDFIQTDAAINVGNSGGALVDLQGRLVGINTAIISGSGTSSGVGFAVPVDMMDAVISHLERDGVVRRGQLGVIIRDHTPLVEDTLHLGAEHGALITQVMPDSVADQVGLQVSDLVIAVNGESITSSRELRNAVGLAGVDQVLELGLLRDGEQVSVNAMIIASGADAVAASADNNNGRRADESRFLGAQLQDVAGAGNGVVVADVAQRSPAWAAGLRPGDIIAQVNRQPAQSLREFNQLLSEEARVVALGVVRDGQQLLLIVS
ncbi:Do family serine endopeptidase [Pseudohongiella sp.]|uniref:PDZ domain-containing protein n=2 Tax=root TaxID=1 RepID=A0A0F9W2H5_9ZZZZ|nr:Do family serine endopeptidase [Pseudohongiella sp.]HDZ09287.1 Do family serine endopeptidase [Pseudohongiella sp.]HEA62151.1 Do family serine endopeptidase [Pseudohongiella sp.]